MSWSENRREYLDKKYEGYDDESDLSYTKGSQRQTPRKSNHKHEYKNCVLVYQEKRPNHAAPSGFELRDYHMLGSYCTICGKVGRFDEKVDSFGWWHQAHCLSISDPSRITFDEMYEKYKKVLPVFEIPSWDCKYIPR